MDYNNLPTAEQYRNGHPPVIYEIEAWSEPKYLCPKCKKGGMRRNNIVMKTTQPIQFEYQCNQCGYVEHQYG